MRKLAEWAIRFKCAFKILSGRRFILITICNDNYEDEMDMSVIRGGINSYYTTHIITQIAEALNENQRPTQPTK